MRDSGGARAAGGGKCSRRTWLAARPGPTGRIGPPQARGASSRPPGAPFLIEKQWRNERERTAIRCRRIDSLHLPEIVLDDDFGVCFSATVG